MAIEENVLDFKVVKHVTLPLLKLGDDQTVFVRIEEPIFKAKDIKSKAEPKPGEEPKAVKQAPELMQVTNLKDGVRCQMIANTVLATELRETYPGDKYVGKSFRIGRNKIEGSKQYATFSIAEIEVTAKSTQPKK
jgi:hypothetical protein